MHRRINTPLPTPPSEQPATRTRGVGLDIGDLATSTQPSTSEAA